MQTYSRRPSAVSRFELSAAALHIIAMALMLMDHLWRPFCRRRTG